MVELDKEDLPYFIEALREAGATKNPADYYFQVFSDPESAIVPLYAFITPKKCLDDTGIPFDQHISQEAGGLLRLAPDYYELEEGSVEPGDESATFASMEADLKARGFIPHSNLNPNL